MAPLGAEVADAEDPGARADAQDGRRNQAESGSSPKAQGPRERCPAVDTAGRLRRQHRYRLAQPGRGPGQQQRAYSPIGQAGRPAQQSGARPGAEQQHDRAAASRLMAASQWRRTAPPAGTARSATMYCRYRVTGPCCSGRNPAATVVARRHSGRTRPSSTRSRESVSSDPGVRLTFGAATLAEGQQQRSGEGPGGVLHAGGRRGVGAAPGREISRRRRRRGPAAEVPGPHAEPHHAEPEPAQAVGPPREAPRAGPPGIAAPVAVMSAMRRRPAPAERPDRNQADEQAQPPTRASMGPTSPHCSRTAARGSARLAQEHPARRSAEAGQRQRPDQPQPRHPQDQQRRQAPVAAPPPAAPAPPPTRSRTR